MDVPLMSLPRARGRRAPLPVKTADFQELAQIDGGPAVVRQLDADHVAAGDDGDADGDGTQAAGDIVGEADDPGGTGAWCGLQLVEGDDRAGLGVRDLAADAEIVEHGLQLARDLVQRLLGERGLGVWRTGASRSRLGSS